MGRGVLRGDAIVFRQRVDAAATTRRFGGVDAAATTRRLDAAATTRRFGGVDASARPWWFKLWHGRSHIDWLIAVAAPIGFGGLSGSTFSYEIVRARTLLGPPCE